MTRLNRSAKDRRALRSPLPVPFPVGTRLAYIGERCEYADPEGRVILLGPDTVADIVEVREGHRGTGEVYDHDEDGAPLYDQTVDGASVWVNARGQRRAIIPATANQWEEA